MTNTRELFVSLKTATDLLSNVKSELCQSLSLCDRKLTDLSHYLELEDLGLLQMRKIAQKQKQVLSERRLFKNEIVKLEAAKVIFSAGNVLKKYDAHVRGLGKMKYTPREISLEEALS